MNAHLWNSFVPEKGKKKKKRKITPLGQKINQASSVKLTTDRAVSLPICLTLVSLKKRQEHRAGLSGFWKQATAFRQRGQWVQAEDIFIPAAWRKYLHAELLDWKTGKSALHKHLLSARLAEILNGQKVDDWHVSIISMKKKSSNIRTRLCSYLQRNTLNINDNDVKTCPQWFLRLFQRHRTRTCSALKEKEQKAAWKSNRTRH